MNLESTKRLVRFADWPAWLFKGVMLSLRGGPNKVFCRVAPWALSLLALSWVTLSQWPVLHPSVMQRAGAGAIVFLGLMLAAWHHNRDRMGATVTGHPTGSINRLSGWLVGLAALLATAALAGAFSVPRTPPRDLAASPQVKANSTPQETTAEEPVGSRRKTLPPPPLPDINSMRSQELGALILALMPRRDGHWRWNTLANSPSVHWFDNPVLEQTDRDGEILMNSRTGVVRVNVLGQQTTRLRQRLDEVWWTLRYMSPSDVKWGVRSIGLHPGLPWEEDCFGTFYEGCHFDVHMSLQRAGIRVHEVCTGGLLGVPATVMRLSHQRRATVFLKLSTNYGSGGENASLVLLPGEEKVDCDE